MPNWKEVHEEIKAAGSTHDIIRKNYLTKLGEYTGRNVIIYYSGWLQKSELYGQPGIDFGLNDSDKNGFMTCINKMDKSKGLDLILHTPGGDTAATESLADYLRSQFGTNMRAIIPQIAMSAGTMLACACIEIIMGHHSSLGPVDPQMFGHFPAHGIIEEFKRAASEIASNPNMIPVWQPIIAKYSPTLIGECEKAVAWSQDMVREWLDTGMFKDDPDRAAKIDRVIKELSDHALTKSHNRHISKAKANDIGLKICTLEDDEKLQDLTLTIHHICIQTLVATKAIKIIQNQLGVAFIQTAERV